MASSKSCFEYKHLNNHFTRTKKTTPITIKRQAQLQNMLPNLCSKMPAKSRWSTHGKSSFSPHRVPNINCTLFRIVLVRNSITSRHLKLRIQVTLQSLQKTRTRSVLPITRTSKVTTLQLRLQDLDSCFRPNNNILLHKIG
jgi:hypothetical protein